MRIGIASPIDITYFLPFIHNEKDREKIIKNTTSSAAHAVHTLILSFLHNGHDIRVFTLSKTNFVLKGSSIEIYGVKACDKYPVKYLWGDFINAKNIKKIIRDNLEGLDVLHAHWTYTYAYAASDLTNQLPVFCTVRDWAPFIWKIESAKNKLTWTFRWLMNELVFRSKKINFISNSPYTAALIKGKYSIDTPVIPNPIKTTFLLQEKRITPVGLNLICISSSNDKRKNIKTLLLAFQQLLIKYPDAHLSLIGSPFTEKSTRVQEWANKGLLKQVSLIGRVNHDELTIYLDRARIFVTPSIEETFGNTLLEAMARKVPIVAGKDSGAIPYVLEKGRAGFLCDVTNCNNLTTMIEYAYLHSVEAEEKVKYAFQLLEREYVDIKIANKHLELYSRS